MLFFNRISAQERSEFANNLSVMLKSGITIDSALSSLAKQTKSPYFKKAIENVESDIARGIMLSKAFEKEVKVFSPIFVSLIAAGEQSGTLQENLTFLADWFERSADLTREVKGATLYPKLVLGAALLLGSGLGVFILPRLIPLFEQLDVELPLITRVLLATTVFLQTYWFWCIIGLVSLGIVCFLLTRIYIVKRFIHSLQISMPFLGPIIGQYQLALITQLFATLLRSGLPIINAMVIIEAATPNVRFKESIKAMQQEVTKGRVLSNIMARHTRLYPPMAVNIVSVGEQSGTLADSFAYLSAYYTKEVKAKAKRLPTIVEPLLLIFIALVVGLIALAIIVPIYEITGSINK